MLTFVQVLDFIGTFAFAISGIRLASAKQFVMNFPNPSFFGKYFKHHTGMSPSEYKVQ